MTFRLVGWLVSWSLFGQRPGGEVGFDDVMDLLVLFVLFFAFRFAGRLFFLLFLSNELGAWDWGFSLLPLLVRSLISMFMFFSNDTDDLQKKRCLDLDWIVLSWVSVCGGWMDGCILRFVLFLEFILTLRLLYYEARHIFHYLGVVA